MKRTAYSLSSCFASIMMLAVFLIPTVSLAQKYPALTSALKKIRETPLVEMNVEKIVKSELMGKETKHDGKVFLGQGLFRWENKTPTETLLVFDGKTLWNVQYPDPDFPGDIQITKAQINKKNKSQMFLANLLSQVSFLEDFNVKLQVKGNDATYFAEPKDKAINIQDLQIYLNVSKKEMTGLSYKDDVDNKTTLNFSNIKFKQESNAKLFQYKAPKGAKVTEL